MSSYFYSDIYSPLSRICSAKSIISATWNLCDLYISDPYSYIYTLTNPSNSSAVMKMKNADGANAIYTEQSYGEKFYFIILFFFLVIINWAIN